MDHVDRAYSLLKHVLGEVDFQAKATRLENRNVWVCTVGRESTGIAGLRAMYLVVFKLFLDDGHVDYFVQFPTLPNRIKDETLLKDLGECQGVYYEIVPVDLLPAESQGRGDVWVQFGVGFSIERMTPEFLEDVTSRLCLAIADAAQLIPPIGEGPRTANDLRGLFT